MPTRTIELVETEPCGCFVQRITDTWMGETIVYDNPVICPEHW